MLQGHCGNRRPGLLVGGHQFGLELWGVGAVRTPHRIAGCLRDFEHHVHGRLRAHDLPQADQVIQDGLATRLRPSRSLSASTCCRAAAKASCNASARPCHLAASWGLFRKRKKSYVKPNSARVKQPEARLVCAGRCPSEVHLNLASGHRKKSRQDRMVFAFF